MKTYTDGVNEMAERTKAILKDRSKGEVDTWGFVAMFLEMVDEAKSVSLTSELPAKADSPSGPTDNDSKEEEWDADHN